MAYTSNRLISNAYYLAGIVSREFETVSGAQFVDGLEFLNDILEDKTVDNSMLPYYTKHTFSAVPGQEEYFIQDLIDIETLTFFIDDVRYSMKKEKRRKYFGTPRAENITSLPVTWHLEREFDGARVFLYFKPDTNYPLELWGQFRLAQVVANQDLALTLDRFYINYLKYELAYRLCQEFNFTVPGPLDKQLSVYQAKISKQSAPLDLQMTKLSTLGNKIGLNYADINIGRGWRP